LRATENASSDMQDATTVEKHDKQPLTSIVEEEATNGVKSPEDLSSQHTTNGTHGDPVDDITGQSKHHDSALEDIGAALFRAGSVRGRLANKKKSDYQEGSDVELSSIPDRTIKLVLQVDQMILDLTQRVLDYSDPEAEWSWEASIPATQENGLDATTSKKRHKNSKSFTTDLPPPPPPPFRAVLDEILSVRAEPSKSKSLPQKEVAEAASPPTDVGAGISADRLAQLEQSVADMLQDTKKKGPKKAGSKKAQIEIDSDEDEPIILKDAVGRKFTFPYEICKKWKVLLGFHPRFVTTLSIF
jgi:hypothetical protein